MNERNTSIKLILIGKEYLLACKENEKESLHDAADLLNQRVNEIKKSGKIVGSERLAIMTSLNMASELLTYKKESQHYTESVDNTLSRLQDKINHALISNSQMSVDEQAANQGSSKT